MRGLSAPRGQSFRPTISHNGGFTPIFVLQNSIVPTTDAMMETNHHSAIIRPSFGHHSAIIHPSFTRGNLCNSKTK
jgi:hypothetical protein